MAEENAMAEVMNLLEVEPTALALPAPGPDIPALRENLAILVSSGRCKESIGVNLTHEQVKRLEDNDVMKYSKRLEAYVGAKTTEALIDSVLTFSTKALGLVVKLKDPEALKNGAEKRLHHLKGAVNAVRQPCAEMRPFACFCQFSFDLGKTCRF